MSYRTNRRRRSYSRNSRNSSLHHQTNYVSEHTASRRHEFQTGATRPPGTTLGAGDYLYFPLLQFRRTFHSTTENQDPTPTASNNYASTTVMNGSQVRNFSATITLQNRASIGGHLDVYEVICSFYDVLIWDTLNNNLCPFSFQTELTTGESDKRGTVYGKTIAPKYMSKNQIKSYKYIQRYVKHRGLAWLPTEDGGNGGKVVIQINRVPPKCVRSQTGMFWALFFVNDSGQNGSQTLNLDAQADISFNEIPSAERLPYLS